MNEFLARIADLLHARNDADRAIAELLGRPATPGNIGEEVAAKVFGIRLVESGSNAGFDGTFSEGPLAGKTVNIKTYSRHESILDISQHPCDYYLVLAGSVGSARHLPWGIESVFLFDSITLLQGLERRQVKVGVATSVLKVDWEAARLFPPGPSSDSKFPEVRRLFCRRRESGNTWASGLPESETASCHTGIPGPSHRVTSCSPARRMPIPSDLAPASFESMQHSRGSSLELQTVRIRETHGERSDEVRCQVGV